MDSQQPFYKRLITAYPLPALFVIFFMVQAMLYMQIGIFTEMEAEKYVEAGNFLFDNGQLQESKYIFYLPVILLVYISRAIGASYLLVVLVQVALSGLSLYYFYRLGQKISNIYVAFFSTLLLTLFLPLQSWNFYLYTDSIFISLTIIYSYVLFVNRDKGLKGTLVILLFLGLLILSRPHGMLFIPPTIVYLLLRRQSRTMLVGNAILCVLLLGGMYFLLNAAFTGGSDMDAMKPFIEEHIICFVPLKPGGAVLDLAKTTSPVNDLFYYIFHNPLHFLRLMGLRLLSFFNLTRPFYSTIHNVLLVIFMIPVYIFAIPGVRKLWQLQRNFSIFLFALLILYPLGATFQCDDWHSRFTMVIIPYLMLLAGMGAFALLRIKDISSKG